MTPVGGNVKVWTGRGVGGTTVVVVVVGAPPLLLEDELARAARRRRRGLVLLALLVVLVAAQTGRRVDAWPQQSLALEVPAPRQVRQRDVARVVLRQQLVDELVDVRDVPALERPKPQLRVVRVERLEVLVDVRGPADASQVKRAEDADVLVLLVGDELDDDVELGLDLEHLQQEAHELRRLPRPAVRAADVLQLDRAIHERFRRQAEAVLLPVLRRVDLGPQNLLDDALRVRAVHALGGDVCRVRGRAAHGLGGLRRGSRAGRLGEGKGADSAWPARAARLVPPKLLKRPGGD
mmetsp:Transcript_5383/g.15943  ORF Transcript_5383/g.15943 Transcript_5383/m.15943 type:complete len:294 (+) Transcript_5383:448-1329(+)